MYQFTIPQAFWDGECFDAYRWMGAHPSAGPHGEAGWQFTLFAPAAPAGSGRGRGRRAGPPGRGRASQAGTGRAASSARALLRR